MLELIKELLKREWEFQLTTDDGRTHYHLWMILDNEYRHAYSDTDAKDLLNEIKTYW